MFHLAFYVPSDHAEKVKEAMFAAGAGKIGNYAKCSHESNGIGQFMPLEGSQPFMGTKAILERVSELKVEMVCEKQFVEAVLAAMKATHPYETPAYYVMEMVRF
jgi:hypothetical protein